MSRPRKWIAFGLIAGLIAVGTAIYFAWAAESEYERPVRAPWEEGRALLEDYFAADAELAKLAKPRTRERTFWLDRQRAARDGFLAWLETTRETLGIDLRAKTETVLELIDAARVKYLTTSVRPGELDYLIIRDPKGMARHEYAVLLPKTYGPKGRRLPLILSLHGRVINPRHPALKNDFSHRGRQVVWNNWLRSAAAQEAIIVAPTTRPHGFTFEGDDTFKDLQTLYRTLGEALRSYRIDWNRVFLEVEGRAMLAACEQTFVFAGFIVRDRVDDRRRPFVDPSEFFVFENLNGVPLCYVADRAHWTRVGEPIAEALRTAYRKADAIDNLLILQADRDANEALDADDARIRGFLTAHRHVKARRSFDWRFFRPLMVAPMPFELGTKLEFDRSAAARNAPLVKKAGSMHVEVSQQAVPDSDGQEQLVNLVVVDVTEASGFVLRLAEGWIDFDLPVTVQVNGKVVIERQVVARDWRWFWDNVLPQRFFMCPYLGSVEAKFDRVPEFAPGQD